MTRYWSFYDYKTELEANLIQVWYQQQDVEVRVAFDTTLNELATAKDWDDPDYFKELDRLHSGLGEIKFSVGKRKFRPVGFTLLFPGEDNIGQFVILLGCEKSGRIYTPSRAFETALELKHRFLFEHLGSLTEHDF